MMKYGLPYMGSKNKIIDKIQDVFPAADNFYDLFSGGGAVTHCMITKNRYKHYFINDIQADMIQFFINAINGEYKDRTEFVSRNEFMQLKDSDAYIRTLFSFANRGYTYTYGDKIEDYKLALHQAIVNNEFGHALKYGFDLTPIQNIQDLHSRRLEVRKIILDNMDNNTNRLFKDINKKSAERVEHLERYESVQNLENLITLDRLTYSMTDYQDIPILDNSVIYCDIPYKDTTTYINGSFDYERFYTWAENQSNLCLISEYDMPLDRFAIIKAIKHRPNMASKSNNRTVTEKVFIPRHQLSTYNYTEVICDDK